MILLNGLPSSCELCPLSTNPHSGYFTKVTGKGTTGVMIIGEASGEAEAKEGTPFIDSAPAGSILEKAIKLSGLKRDDFWITNLLRCRPPNNLLAGASYERTAIDHCNQYLRRELERLQPRAIVALGAVPTRELTGFSGGKSSISYIRGFPLVGPYGTVVIPTYHPAFLARGNTRLLPLLVKDLNSARSAAAGRLSYVIDPSLEMIAYEGLKALEDLYNQCLDDPECWIAYDIETPTSLKGVEDELIEFQGHAAGDRGDVPVGEHEDDVECYEMAAGPEGPSYEKRNDRHTYMDDRSSSILSIQFAISDRWGVYGDWGDGRIREIAQRILQLPNPKVAHNGDHFDRPRLEREGITIHGEHYDSLSMRRALQPDLPAGLQQIAVDYGWRWPWKHYSGTNAVLYGVADVCSLVRIVSKLPFELDKLGMWDGYQTFVRGVRDVVEIPWERRGIPMSVERIDELREYIAGSVEGKMEVMTELIPSELNGKRIYTDPPDRVRDLIYEKHADMFAPVEKTYKNGKTKMIKSKVKLSDVYRMILSGELLYTQEQVLSYWPELRLGIFDGIPRLYEHLPFNPRSPLQMINYLKHKGHEVPKDFKKGTETTADKLMKRLEVKTGDPVIKLTREIRALEKMRDSYTGKVGSNGVAEGGWVPDSDGRLRTRAMTNSTWQFSSVSPNVFTLPKRRKELADRFRKCVAAEPGHVMIEFDYKAFHDLMTASLANDDIKWRTAKIDPHSYVAAWLVKDDRVSQVLKWSDEALKEYLAEINERYSKVRDEQAKPLNHGTNFGQGYRRLYFENEEYFESEAQAKTLLLMLKRIYPKTFAWQESLLESLDIGGGRTPYLQSVWGARRWFWDVWAWKKTQDGRWYKAKGQDAEKALAFLPANNAHGMFRKKLLEAAANEWLDKYELVLFPHDAWVFHPLIELAEECIENISRLMESPVIELANPILCPEGLSCAVDIKIGPSMGEMRKVR